MKIICVGRNYSEHAKELNNEIPEEPVIFLKPDTALLKQNKPFFLPDWSQNIQYEAEIVLRISKNGKYIDEAFAHKYYDAVTLGIDFTARDIQNNLKAKGLPWELAKAFDNSAAIGKMIDLKNLNKAENIAFRLEKNGEIVQQSQSDMMLFSFSKIISFVSTYINLKMGDLIFTGTPQGVGKVNIGDHFTGFIENEEVFSFKIK